VQLAKPEKDAIPKYPPYIADNNFILPFIRGFCELMLEMRHSFKLTYLDATELLKKLGFVGAVERMDSQSFIIERSLMNDMWILVSARGGWTDPLSVLSFLLALFN